MPRWHRVATFLGYNTFLGPCLAPARPENSVSPVHAADFQEFRMSQQMTTENGETLQQRL
jgi:hypothetical protein